MGAVEGFPNTRAGKKSGSMMGLPTRFSIFVSILFLGGLFQGEEILGWTVAYSPCLFSSSCFFLRGKTHKLSLGLLGSNAFFLSFFLSADKEIFFFQG